MNHFEDWFGGQFDDYVANLETLVNIDSGSYHTQGVARVIDWVGGFLEQDGIQVERFYDGDRLICALASVNPGKERHKAALLLGHCDTVFPKGEVERRPFTRQGDVAYGPGVADMKAGVLMNAYLLQAWKRMGNPEMMLSALFTCDEEIGSPASGKVIESICLRHQYVFNSEPGRPNGNFVIGRKGGVFFDVNVEGKPAHAGVNFYEGISAISALADKMREMEGLISRDDGITLNVGLINGGMSVNTVAPHAVASVDLRIKDLEQRERCLAEVARICEQSNRGERTQWAIKGEFKPFVQSPGSVELAEKYLRTSLDQGVVAKGELTGGCSDSGIASACGCDVVCSVGPVGGGFHTPDEYVRLDSVAKKASVLFSTLNIL